jgi:hypothetical protein
MPGVTNGYLQDLGKEIIGKTFLGSFPCDMQPNPRLKNKFSVIFNLSKHNEKGTHFVAIFADATRLLYFDPLGNACKNKKILEFLTEHKYHRKIRKKFPKIQSDESIFCGYFCIGFILAMTNNIPLKKFFSLFDYDDLNKNDSIIIEFIHNNV